MTTDSDVVTTEHVHAMLSYFEQVLDRPDYDRLMAAINGFTETVATLRDDRHRADVAGLTPAQFLLLMLVWVMTFGLPLAEADMPLKAQVIISNEIATTGLAVVLTSIIRKKG